MNRSFDRLHLVNTYGAFGSVGRDPRRGDPRRHRRSAPRRPDTVWRAYEFPCKPGDPDRRPCVISPYHYRLDWQLWFAAMSTIGREPWLVRLVVKLLRGDADVKPLLAVDPFPDAPPRFIRASSGATSSRIPATAARPGGGGRSSASTSARSRSTSRRSRRSSGDGQLRRYGTRKASKDDHTFLEYSAQDIDTLRDLRHRQLSHLPRRAWVSDASEGQFAEGDTSSPSTR